jgi:hypothetical protein
MIWWIPQRASMMKEERFESLSECKRVETTLNEIHNNKLGSGDEVEKTAEQMQNRDVY